MSVTTHETRAVLSGAYRGKAGDHLTHTIQTSETGERVLCRRVRVEHLVDRFADPAGLQQPPTCAQCLRRDPRFQTTERARPTIAECKDHATEPGGI